MNVYKLDNLSELLKNNTYAGRGIVVGKSEDGNNAVIAYFIIGRSENSRNRVFVEKGDEVIIYPFDESKVEDPSLIIYSPIKKVGDKLVVTNGDQTNTICDFLKNGKGFVRALRTRGFEPDAPNFTPRISCMLTFDKEDFTYEMSILKSADSEGSACARYTFSYPSLDNTGHFIHTYVCDGNPIPTFMGEPERISIPDSIDELTDDIWTNLDENNKISLYVKYTDLKTGKSEHRLINKNK